MPTLPFFISHQGCPHSCTFCDQVKISGSIGYIPTEDEIDAKVVQWLEHSGKKPIEAAFFGGSFTMLPSEIQSSLLKPLEKWIKRGFVSNIRISTRPDAINIETIKMLKRYSVSVVELGIQSMDDTVLALAERHHTSTDSVNAIAMLKENNFLVGGQLLPGLLGDSEEKSLKSTDRIISAGVDFLRIYPALIFEGTALETEYRSLIYSPLSRESAISVCKKMLHLALKRGKKVIRIGLQADEGLNNKNIVGGYWSPAFGQEVYSALYYDLILKLAKKIDAPEFIEVKCNKKRVSDCIGHKRSNLLDLLPLKLKVTADETLHQYEISLSCQNQVLKGNIIDDLSYDLDN